LFLIIIKNNVMSKLTKDFSLQEFASKDGSGFPNDVLINISELARNLQVLRDYIGKSIRINSGYRSPKHNASLPGAVKNSQHVKGKASDLVVSGMTPKELANAIELLISQGKMKQGGIGVYPNFTHYDIRGVKARW
jgi:uncharacterized protein YcbK (DUF882 family)